MGVLPVIDMEYFGYITLLQEGRWSQFQEHSKPLVIVEMGTRFGSWVARGALAIRKLAPRRRVQLIAVEQNKTRVEYVAQHLLLNDIHHEAAIIEENWPLLQSENTLSNALDDTTHIDVMFVNLGGAEIALADSSMGTFLNKVRVAHVLTHSLSIHLKLLQYFRDERGMHILYNLPATFSSRDRFVQTFRGPVRLNRHGIISVEGNC